MRRLGWLAAAGALACAPERPPWEVPPVVWAGEHLEYAPQDGAHEPCGGTLPYMDRYVELVAELMDVQLEQPLVYIQGSDEAESLCENPDALGCARGGEIFAHVIPQEQYRYPVVGCEGPVVRRVRCDETEVVGMSEMIACEDAGTLGPRDGEIWNYLAIEVEDDGKYWISGYGPVAAAFERIEVKECALGCESVLVERPVGIVLGEGPVVLRAGRYVVKVVRPEGEPGEVEIGVWGAGCG